VHGATRPEGVVILALAMLTACAGPRFVEGFLIDEARGFKLQVLRDGWTRVEATGAEVAFRAEPGGQIAAFIVSCDGEQQLPLKTLARHLFFGIEAKRIVTQEPILLDGAEAVHTVLEGRVSEDPVMVSSYVAKDARCVYDLLYVASPATFDERLADFEQLAGSLAFTGTRHP
jgi:hypothetical protein